MGIIDYGQTEKTCGCACHSSLCSPHSGPCACQMQTFVSGGYMPITRDLSAALAALTARVAALEKASVYPPERATVGMDTPAAPPLPCPFCGSAADSTRTAAWCRNAACAVTGWSLSRAEWNRRAL